MSKICVLSVRLSGGFGNQLFQYCAGLALSRRWGRRMSLDLSWYRFSSYKPPRPYRLDHFSIPEAGRRPGLLEDARLLALDQLGRRYTIVSKILAAIGMPIIFEKDGHTRPEYLYMAAPASPFVSLSGFWQTADHFLQVRDLIGSFLQPLFSISAEAKELLSSVTGIESGFLHIRRGDFVSLGHPLLPVSYYQHAVSAIESRRGHAVKWFVFSDDPAWCREALGFLKNPVFVNLKTPQADLEEFQIMRACRNGIIANSSYSWWAAALIGNPDAIVCAPRNRYGEQGGADIQQERVLPWWVLVD